LLDETIERWPVSQPAAKATSIQKRTIRLPQKDGPPKQLSAKQLFMKIASEKVQVLIDGVQMEKSRLGACYRAIQQKALSGHSGAMKCTKQFAKRSER
jgi:hypothetical protein